MATDKDVRFFEEVLTKTRAGKIPWEPTANPSLFAAPLAGKFTLTISESIGDSYTNTEYELILKDSDARQLTGITNFHPNVSVVDIRDLYESARRKALNVDAKIDSVLGELEKL